jgi:hypothetical protein
MLAQFGLDLSQLDIGFGIQESPHERLMRLEDGSR